MGAVTLEKLGGGKVCGSQACPFCTFFSQPLGAIGDAPAPPRSSCPQSSKGKARRRGPVRREGGASAEAGPGRAGGAQVCREVGLAWSTGGEEMAVGGRGWLTQGLGGSVRVRRWI